MFETYRARSGTLAPVWRLEIQTRPHDANRLLDAIVAVDPLVYGRYRRNAAVSAVGAETGQPQENSTTTNHLEGFEVGGTETYPMVQLFVSIERNAKILENVMNAVIDAHHYEEPVIYIREEWASRAAYDPGSSNPNRWWNDGRGLPEQVPFGIETEERKQEPSHD
ncbi:MAG: hypothetical protein AAF724_16810 [Pseudomonadota bacterium]